MRRFVKSPAAGPLAVALLTLAAVASTLSPETNGPGVTCDEYYDTVAGKGFVRAWRQHGLRLFSPEVIRATFDHLTIHPPLGRWLLGWSHALADPAPDQPFLVWLEGGRFASACEFALLVLVVGWATSIWAGRIAGTAAAVALASMPRSFGHAHLATLDTPTSLFYVLAVLALVAAVERPALRWTVLAGACAGLALATKIHGVLLAPVAVIAFTWRFGRRSVVPLAVWALAAGAVFFAAWPWLWIDPVGRLREFFMTATERQSLHAFYWGQVWSDRDVPWHYPWVMFAVAQPAGWLLLGMVGAGTLRGAWRRRAQWVIAAVAGLVPLIVFSLPGVPVYDGVRLFLMAFPLWAIFVGVGVGWLVEKALVATRARRVKLAALAVVLAGQIVGVVAMHPYQLSYYSSVVGGLWGAQRLGFEVSYWGDSVSGPLVAATARDAAGQKVLYAPHLAPFQAGSVQLAVPAFGESGVEIVGWDGAPPAAGWMLVYRRRADLAPVERTLEKAQAQVAAEVTRQGVWLSRLYRLTPQDASATRRVPASP